MANLARIAGGQVIIRWAPNFGVCSARMLMRADARGLGAFLEGGAELAEVGGAGGDGPNQELFLTGTDLVYSSFPRNGGGSPMHFWMSRAHPEVAALLRELESSLQTGRARSW